MGKRIQSRHGNGRFRRATLENTFGFSALVCAACRRFNTFKVGEARPENCHACGVPLVDISEVSKPSSMGQEGM